MSGTWMPLPATIASRSSMVSGRVAWWFVLHAQQFSSSIGTHECPPIGWSPRGDHPIGGHSWVPMDDENCWAWSTNHHATRPLTMEERDAMIAGKGIHVPLIPGSFRPIANKDNDY